MGKLLMTRKARRLYSRIQFGLHRKRENVRKLQLKRKRIDLKNNLQS
jgi:hypothetical protein